MGGRPQKILDAAEQAGIPVSNLTRFVTVPVMPLGYSPVPRSTWPTPTRRRRPGRARRVVRIETVNDSAGTSTTTRSGPSRRYPRTSSADTISAMRKVVNSGGAGTGSSARTVCPTAGKTGTATAGPTNDQHVSSSWFAGYSPKLATAVMYNRGGLGNGDLEGYMEPFFGGQIPAKTFQTYMNSALEGTECGTFPKPRTSRAPRARPTRSPRPSGQRPAPQRRQDEVHRQPQADAGDLWAQRAARWQPRVRAEVEGRVPDGARQRSVYGADRAADEQADCEAAAAPGTHLWRPCTLPQSNGGWLVLPVLAGMIGLGRRA